METPEAHPLTPRQVEQAGALVVDVRTELQFDEAHIPGAVSITARRAGFGSKLAWLAEPGQPIVLVGRDDEDALEAAGLAAAVGLRDIAGYLAGGMTSWREERRPVATVRAHDRARAARALGGRRPPAGARRARALRVGRRPHPRLGVRALPRHPTACRTGIDPARPVAVVCGSGQRSAVAASLLLRHGAGDVIHVVDGGVPLWERSGWPVER